MGLYRADLHIHTVLSPCADLDMSPVRIVAEAVKKGLNLIGITDHNATQNCRTTWEIGRKSGIEVLCGAEVNTREEVHLLTFFETFEQLEEFEDYLQDNLPSVPNDTDVYGYQLIVNEQEEITGQSEYLLINALRVGIDEVCRKVKVMGGISIPAHIDRAYNSILSQLGFIPDNLPFSALEVSYAATDRFRKLAASTFSHFPILFNSDAHRIPHIGRASTLFKMDKPGFAGLKEALARGDVINSGV